MQDVAAAAAAPHYPNYSCHLASALRVTIIAKNEITKVSFKHSNCDRCKLVRYRAVWHSCFSRNFIILMEGITPALRKKAHWE